MRKRLKDHYLEGFRSRFTHIPPDELKADAIVFAPHQDDEVLGCGGTILKKTQAGADVKIVFMTDGTLSHRHLVEPGKLRILRMQEAVRAGEQLGVAEKNIIFLDFEDGTLLHHKRNVLGKLVEILLTHCPNQVFTPHRAEPTPDHIATGRFVQDALALAKIPVTVFEYAVWYWYHWPWVDVIQNSRREAREILRNTFAFQFGRRIIHDFNHFFEIEDELDAKWNALREHRTQTERFMPDQNWLILQDVAHGDFLNCFFQGFEVFDIHLLNKDGTF